MKEKLLLILPMLIFMFIALTLPVSVEATAISCNELESDSETLFSETVLQPITGYCGKNGNNVTYAVTDSNKDGVYDTLNINGEGDMEDYRDFFYDFSDFPSPWDRNIEKIIIAGNVTSIGDFAFSSCTSLTTVTISNSVVTIGRGAFANCTALTTVIVPDSVTIIGCDAFEGCTALSTIRIPDSVNEIGMGAFDGCVLTAITIPEGVSYIGELTFGGCQFTTVTIPDSVTEICDNAFNGCTALETVAIPDGVTTIRWAAFANCTALETVAIPDSVTDIGNYAFYGCSSLASVFIPDNGITIGVSAIPDAASQIKYEINEENSVVIMEISLGKGCTSVEIPDILYNYSIASVDESFRSLVSDTGHIHKYNEAGICQICNKSKEQDEGAGIDTDILEGPDTWKSKEGVEGFVFRLYNVAMHRDAEEAGLNDWNTRLNTKEETAAQVAWGFIFSKEFENFNYNDVQYVKLLYRTMFGREADKDGLEGWVSDLENGMSREYVFRGFAESQEFTNLCGNFGVERGNVSLNQYRDQNVGVTGFIARLYTQMLGRDFDEEGIEYWCRKYLTGENTIEEVATVGFLHSKELENLNLSDTEFVTRMYCTFLNREPDEAGLADWVNRLETGRGTRDSLVYGFTLSKEFGNIKALYGL